MLSFLRRFFRLLHLTVLPYTKICSTYIWPLFPPDLPDQVLRVFKADQQSRYIMISKDTTAKEVVIQAIREFAVTATPDQYSLCEVSVTPEGVIKQRRLPDQLSKLADRIQLSGRYTVSLLLDFFNPSSGPRGHLKEEQRAFQSVFKMN